MFARVITMLAILAITVVTTVASAHAARMSAVPDHSAHIAEMMHSPHNSKPACDGDQHGNSTDAGICERLCVGLSAFLPVPDEDAGDGLVPASHDLPADTVRASRAPGLSERPPQSRRL